MTPSVRLRVNYCTQSDLDCGHPHTRKRRIDKAFPHELRANTPQEWGDLASAWLRSVRRRSGLAALRDYVLRVALSNPAVWAYLAPNVIKNGG
jgi:hypothetical protein